MILQITRAGNPPVIEEAAVVSMETLFSPKNLLLVREFTMDVEDTTVDSYEIKKVQFVASCKTKFANDVVAAFFIDDDGFLDSHIITDNKYVAADPGMLVDFESYLDICKITGEKPMQFYDYIEELKAGLIGKNNLTLFKDTVYNYSDEKALEKAIREDQG